MEEVDSVRKESGAARRKDILSCLAGWVLPGAGHFILGHRIRSLVFFILITFGLVFGLSLKGKVYVIERDKPMTYAGVFAHLGLGPIYFFLKATELGKGKPESPTYTYGKAFITTAGLMNILLILDALDIARGRKEYKVRGEEREEGEES